MRLRRAIPQFGQTSEETAIFLSVLKVKLADGGGIKQRERERTAALFSVLIAI